MDDQQTQTGTKTLPLEMPPPLPNLALLSRTTLELLASALYDVAAERTAALNAMEERVSRVERQYEVDVARLAKLELRWRASGR